MVGVGVTPRSLAVLGGRGPGVLDALIVLVFAAFSFALLFSGYVGPCIRVRRSSDNAVMDIGFVGGWLDVASLLAFVGSGSGYIVTRYDQSGAGRHITNLTAATQPRIVNAGVLESFGGQPAERFGAASGVGYSGTGFALPQPYTVLTTWMATGAPPSSEHTLIGRESTGSSYIYAPGSQVRVQAGTQVIPTGYTANVPQLFGFVFAGAASHAVVNGAVGGALNPGTDPLSNTLYFGYNPVNPARVLAGFMADIIVMPSAASDAEIIRIQRALGAPRGFVVP